MLKRTPRKGKREGEKGGSEKPVGWEREWVRGKMGRCRKGEEGGEGVERDTYRQWVRQNWS